MAVVEVAFSDLNNWLQAQPANTESTPYELKITGLVANNLRNSSTTRTLGYVIKIYGRYVDLSETELPSVTSMEGTFMDCTSLVTAPVIPNGVTNMGNTFRGCTSLVTAPVIPNGVTNMGNTFYFCTALTTPPVIPDSVTNMDYTFYNCSRLIRGPIIPNGVSDMKSTFFYCTSLTTVPKIPSSVENITGCFYGCSALTTFSQSQFDASNISNCEQVFAFCENLTNFYCDTPYELKSWLTTLRSNSILNFPSDPDNCTFNLYSIPAVIPFDKLNNELSALTANTTSTPFKIIIPDLTDLNFGDLDTSNPTLRHVLLSNSTKYVDLSETEIPNTIDPSVGMDEAFYGCTSLVKAPILPNHITSLDKSFKNCDSLTTTPVLPNSLIDLDETFWGCDNLVNITNLPNNITFMDEAFAYCPLLRTIPPLPNNVRRMESTFAGCTSLTIAPTLPNSVTNLYETFEGCTSLVTVPNVPASVTDINRCFKDCSSLEEIEVFEVPLSVLKSNFAGDCFSGCTSLTKIGIRGAGRSSDWHIALLEFGATTVKGKFYDRQGNSVTIPKTTITKNKLKLPVLTDELMFNTQTSFADLESLIEDVLQYNYGYYNKFVVTPKNKQFVLYANDPVNGFTTNLPIGGGGGATDHTPLGTWASFESGVAPSNKWLEAGTRFNEVDYPELYMYLNDTVVPERFEHNKLSDYETVVIPKGSSNPFIAPYDGLLYVNGYTDANDSYKLFINGRETTVSSSIMNTSSYRGIDSETIHISKGDSIYYTGSGQTQAYSSFVQYYKQHLFIKATTGADVETAVSLSTSWYDALKTSMYTYETANIVSSVSNSGEGGGTATLVFCKVNKALKKIRLRIDLQNASRNSFVISTIFDSTKFKVETATMPIQITFTNKTVNSGIGGSYSYVLTSVYENYNRISVYSYPHEFDPTGALSLLLDIDYSMCSTGYGLLES